MAKKLSKKRANRKPAKKSFLQLLFTFPKIALYSFLILSLFTLRQVTIPSGEVQGVSSWQEGAMLSYEEVVAEAKKNTAAGIPIDKYMAVYLWNDKNSNGYNDDGNEPCLKKQFAVKRNGVTKTPTQKNCERAAKYIKVTKNCNNVEFIKVNSSTQYKYTGVYIKDHKRLSGKAIPYDGIDKTYEVCGFPNAEGGDGWGYVYNDVKFGVKQK